ncbi:MAG: hypothetical protein GY861_08980 [bacterium]|nr:hypothetical protein [bacterium]
MDDLSEDMAHEIEKASLDLLALEKLDEIDKEFFEADGGTNVNRGPEPDQILQHLWYNRFLPLLAKAHDQGFEIPEKLRKHVEEYIQQNPDSNYSP